MSDNPGRGDPIRVLVVTGGHALDPDAFFSAFNSVPEFLITHVAHSSPPGGSFFDSEADAWDDFDPTAFDVVLLYDLVAKINDAQKASFLSIVERGVGLVVLHQAITSYPAWDEYEKIVGGRYVIGDTPSKDGVGLSENRYVKPAARSVTQWPFSDFREDVEVPIHFYDTEHPITKGMADFTVQDLVYNGLRMEQDISPLFVSSQIHAGHPFAWWREHGMSKVVYMQLCHTAESQRHPAYQELLRRSVRWVAAGPSTGDDLPAGDVPASTAAFGQD